MTQADSSTAESRAFAFASMSLGILSVPLFVALFYVELLFSLSSFSSYLVNPFAILGIIFGVLHLKRRRRARILAYSGIACSAFAWGLSSYLVFFYAAPNYVEQLARLGYERSVIDNPIRAELFQKASRTTAQWFYSGAVAPFGWYSANQRGNIPIEIPLTGVEPTEPVAFDPGETPFGFFMNLEGVYEWHSESARNGDGQSHVKVYPTIVDGKEIPNSFLFCWEDYPLDAGPSRFIDFTDLIVRVDGITPVSAGSDQTAP